MKKLLSLVLALVLMVALVSCGEAQPKAFTSSGMTITLTTAFKENTQAGYTVCYESSKVAVFILKESFSLQAGVENLTLDEYADLVRQSNASKSPTEIAKQDGFCTMEYNFLNESENQTYSYYCTMFKGTDAFWLVQFACKEGDYASCKDTFVDWAKTVTFDS